MDISSFPAFDLEPAGTAATRWTAWLARLENFLVAYNISNDGRMKAILLHCAGEAVFERFEALDSTGGSGSYNNTKATLSAHFAPQKNVQFEIFNFRRAIQLPEESVSVFHARLLKLSKHCEFSDVAGEVKTQLIQTTSLSSLRDKALSEPNVTLADLLVFARTKECTANCSREMAAVCQPESLRLPTVGGVNQVSSFSSHSKPGSAPRGRGSCTGCGGSCSDRKSCRAWGKTCHKCSKKNHFSAVCKAKSTYHVGSAGTTPSLQAEVSATPSTVRTDLSTTFPASHPTAQKPTASTEYRSLFSVNTQELATPKPYCCELTILGKQLAWQIDTGSCATLLSEKDFSAHFPDTVLEQHSLPTLVTYSKTTFKPLGSFHAQVTHNNATATLPLLVVPGSGPNLLGRDWLEQLRIDWHQVFHLASRPLMFSEVLAEFPALFGEGLGTLKGTQATFVVDKTVPPRCFKARSVPHAYKEMVEVELDRLVAEGILLPV